MASSAPIELSGVALADSTLSCPTDNGDTYGEIIEVVYADKWYKGLYDIVLDPETEQLYGEYWDGHYSVLSPDLEGITAYYNGNTLVLYSVDVPNLLTLFPVNYSPGLTYDENMVLTGPSDFSGEAICALPETLSVASRSFENNRNIKALVLPSSTTIGQYAFEDNMNLQFVQLPNNLSGVGRNAFS